jgi:hypothetical protein
VACELEVGAVGRNGEKGGRPVGRSADRPGEGVGGVGGVGAGGGEAVRSSNHGSDWRSSVSAMAQSSGDMTFRAE